MASKKYLLLVAVVLFTAISSFSQVKIGTYYDSTQIPQKRMAQHTEFLNGTYNFPAKPRNQWEIGIKAGSFKVGGDMPTQLSPGFGVHVRKAFGYIFSMRLEYMYGIGKGLHFRQAENYAKNDAWEEHLPVSERYSAPYATTGPGGFRQIVSSRTGLTTTPFEPVYYNYKTKIQDLSLQGIITLNNIRFHKAKTGFNFYALVGIGGTVYDAKVNALDGNGHKYNFASVAQSSYKDRKKTLDALKALMDDSYETDAENQGDRRPKLFNKTFKVSGTVGFGIAYKLSKRLNLALEDRQTVVRDENIFQSRRR